MPEEGGRLERISEQLDAAARKLRDGDVDGEEAARLTSECAELASQAVAELDRLARGAAQEIVPEQEELL
jgi:F0F1-type ATP synthase membrane subunit b/b'